MANREQHVGIDFKNSTIAINGTTTASKYLGTDSSGNLEWKDGGGGGDPVTSVDVSLSLLTANGRTSTLQTTVRVTKQSSSYVEDTATLDLFNMTCPDDCPDGT